MSTPTPPATAVPEISIVCPMHNEEANIRELVSELTSVLDATHRSYEIVCIDDGSVDDSPRILAELRARDPRIRIIRLRRNFGQTAALCAGFDYARGSIVISLDGDGQHDPAEIPLFLTKLEEGYDVVSGWRQTRPEGYVTRTLPSRFANRAMAVLSGLPIHDFGTTFKAYRREVLEGLDLYGDFHRFIPALVVEQGARITEIPIQVRPRTRGKSHYGILRTITVFFDLIRIRFLSAYLARPLQMFGGGGLVLASLGGAVFAHLIYLRLFHNTSLVAYRWPLFTVSIFAILLGFQLFCLGLLGEIVVRLYFGLKVKRPYAGREVDA